MRKQQRVKNFNVEIYESDGKTLAEVDSMEMEAILDLFRREFGGEAPKTSGKRTLDNGKILRWNVPSSRFEFNQF